MANLSEKLRILMEQRNLTAPQLARLIPCSQPTVWHWLNGTRQPGRKLADLARALGVTVETLVGEDDTIGKFKPVQAIESQHDAPESVVVIPEYRLTFSAGAGSEPVWEEINESEPVYYQLSYFQKHHINPKNCRRATVWGDSMETTLYDGDRILFAEDCQTREGVIVDGAVYALAINGALRVKRLSRRVDGSLVIRSDNPAYPEEIILPEDQENVRIFGRVIESTHTRKFF